MQSPDLDPTAGEGRRSGRPSPLDPTAGERARLERLHPGVDHPVTDPTDPRYATRTALDGRPHAGVGGRIVDPTDPECGLGED